MDIYHWVTDVAVSRRIRDLGYNVLQYPQYTVDPSVQMRTT